MKNALYAGSFDPLTCGHYDLIVRSAKLCERLVVGVINNPSKMPWFDAEERTAMIRACTSELPNVRVDSFSGLLADYVNENNFDVVIRGLRGYTDFDYEIQMAQMNARFYQGKVATMFLMTDPRFSFINSSMAKEVFSLGGSVEGLVPTPVLKAMYRKVESGR